MLENAESNNLEKAYNLPLASHLNLFDRNFDHIVVNPSQAHLHLCHTDHVAGGEDDGDDGDNRIPPPPHHHHQQDDGMGEEIAYSALLKQIMSQP